MPRPPKEESPKGPGGRRVILAVVSHPSTRSWRAPTQVLTPRPSSPQARDAVLTGSAPVPLGRAAGRLRRHPRAGRDP
ncbi:hypothetical protein C8Q78DRAFT_1020682 [Trametes maxima]|nr:hypothetical protein C8Q78DRAFT_1020682 [Trametes maxima]